MYPVSSGFEEWIHLFVQDSFGQKRETLPGRDSYTRRAYLKYVINLAIMWLDQSDRGVNIPTPAHGNTAKVTRLFSKRARARLHIQHTGKCMSPPWKTCGHVSSRDKKKQPGSYFVMRAGLRNNEFCLRGLKGRFFTKGALKSDCYGWCKRKAPGSARWT